MIKYRFASGEARGMRFAIRGVRHEAWGGGPSVGNGQWAGIDSPKILPVLDVLRVLA